MAVLLAVLAAISYGSADFLGGFASRRRSATTVMLYSYPVGGVLMMLLVPAFGGHLSLRTTAFGIAGGLCGMVGVLVMYSLMARAPMNVISPVSAIFAAAVPVLVGVLIGEHPAALTWGAMLLGLLAVMLVSRGESSGEHGRVTLGVIGLALVSGVGFGLYFVFLARADTNSGIWPVVISRLTSAVLIVPLARARSAFVRLDRSTLVMVIATGVLDASANLLFLLASRHGYLSVAAVITSLYPAATVVLAVGILRERTGRLQRAGLALATVSIVLIARG